MQNFSSSLQDHSTKADLPEPPLQSREKKLPDDQEMWTLFKEGQEEAIIFFYYKYYQDIFRFACTYVDRDKAKDVLHDLFLVLLKKGRKLGEVTKVKSYLFKAAYNLIKYAKKRENRSVEILRHNYSEASNNHFFLSIEGRIISKEWMKEYTSRLNQALQQLSVKHREIIDLHYYHGLTYDEIAFVKGSSTNAIKKSLHRAIAKLQDLVS